MFSARRTCVDRRAAHKLLHHAWVMSNSVDDPAVSAFAKSTGKCKTKQNKKRAGCGGGTGRARLAGRPDLGLACCQHVLAALHCRRHSPAAPWHGMAQILLLLCWVSQRLVLRDDKSKDGTPSFPITTRQEFGTEGVQFIVQWPGRLIRRIVFGFDGLNSFT